MKILYLDKEKNYLENLTHCLGPLIRIKQHENVTQAIRSMLVENFDLVVSDIFLEELDGYDLLKLMRKFNLTTPVLFYTHKDDALEKAIAENEGAIGLIKKGDDHQIMEITDKLFVPF